MAFSKTSKSFISFLAGASLVVLCLVLFKARTDSSDRDIKTTINRDVAATYEYTSDGYAWDAKKPTKCFIEFVGDGNVEYYIRGNEGVSKFSINGNELTIDDFNGVFKVSIHEGSWLSVENDALNMYVEFNIDWLYSY